MNDEACKVDPVFEAFLREHPQHIAGTRRAGVGQGEETVIDLETLVHFARWCEAHGHGDPAKAKRFLNDLKRRCYAQGVPWPEADPPRCPNPWDIG